MLKARFLALLVLSLLGLVACPYGDTIGVPQSTSVKPVVGNVTTSSLVLEITVVFSGGLGPAPIKVELLDGIQIVSTAQKTADPDKWNAKYTASITLLKTDNGTKSYKARVSWLGSNSTTEFLESAVSSVTIALP